MARTNTVRCRPWLSMVLLCAVCLVQHSHPALAASQGTGVQTQNVTLTYLRRTLKALTGAIEFFQRQFDKINLDAVIGTRIVEGSLKVLLANLQRKQLTSLLPEDVVTDIRDIYHVAKRVSDDAEPHVYESEPHYYERIGPAIHEGLWELNYTRRTLPRSLTMWTYMPEEAMSEAESDDCLTELFGTSRRTETKCAISDTCWQRMTTFGYSRYSLSHEIFYLQIGEQTGCLPQILWQIMLNGQNSLRELQDTFCGNILREAWAIARGGYPTPQQDLFMEQATLCGMYGYWEFFHNEWLEQILSWQDQAQGCYRWAGWPQERIGEPHHRITKREERRLDNGCLCHRTTVAAGALALYVRFLVEKHIAEANPANSEVN